MPLGIDDEQRIRNQSIKRTEGLRPQGRWPGASKLSETAGNEACSTRSLGCYVFVPTYLDRGHSLAKRVKPQPARGIICPPPWGDCESPCVRFGRWVNSGSASS